MAQYELHRRDGYSRNRVLQAESLEELAELVAEKTGQEVRDA
jgi:hypothetical protein